jgi:hypothetical protein
MGHAVTAGLPIAIFSNGRQGLKIRTPNTNGEKVEKDALKQSKIFYEITRARASRA